jgi:hypothetical protein
VDELYEMAAIAVHIGAFAGSVEELAMQACIRYQANRLMDTHYIIAEAIKYDRQYPTVLVCTPL